MIESEEELTVDRLASGDRPSTFALGLYGAHALKTTGLAVFMVDALGRVVVMPTESVRVLMKPRVKQEELDSFEEATAIQILTKQGDTDDQIVEYLQGREKRIGGS